jgi:hypothetical protein
LGKIRPDGRSGHDRNRNACFKILEETQRIVVDAPGGMFTRINADAAQDALRRIRLHPQLAVRILVRDVGRFNRTNADAVVASDALVRIQAYVPILGGIHLSSSFFSPGRDTPGPERTPAPDGFATDVPLRRISAEKLKGKNFADAGAAQLAVICEYCLCWADIGKREGNFREWRSLSSGKEGKFLRRECTLWYTTGAKNVA